MWERGDQWYLKLHIPRPLQKHFLTSTGKPKSHIVEPLGDSLTQGRLQRNRLVAAYEEVFARLRAGEEMTPDQIKAAVSLDLELLTEQHKTSTLQAFPIWFRRITQQHQISPDDELFQIEVEQISKRLGIPIPLNSELYKMVMAALVRGHQAAYDSTSETERDSNTFSRHRTVAPRNHQPSR